MSTANRRRDMIAMLTRERAAGVTVTANLDWLERESAEQTASTPDDRRLIALAFGLHSDLLGMLLEAGYSPAEILEPIAARGARAAAAAGAFADAATRLHHRRGNH